MASERAENTARMDQLHRSHLSSVQAAAAEVGQLIYIGTVSLKSPCAPYTRLRRMAKLGTLRTSERRYGQRAPYLYKAMSKAGQGNIVMVISGWWRYTLLRKNHPRPRCKYGRFLPKLAADEML